jgi:DNA uptake protein ComE-like DNA-binding protein
MRRRRGFVLIIVLVVVVVVALAAYTFSDLMIAHRQVTEVNGRRIQARMLAQSGVEAVKVFLMQDEATRIDAGGIYNNPVFFQGSVVIPEQNALDRGSFAVIAPLLDDNDPTLVGVRYGLEDESARVNLNLVVKADELQPGAGQTLLMALPGMTEDVADAILDWMDADDEAREYGAEFSDYYSQLQPAYEPRNGPVQSIEELLLVRGVTAELLFGADFNRNGMIDPHEQNISSSLGLGGTGAAITTDLSSSTATRGWSPYLTLYSSEKNVNADGLPRININQDDLETLQAELSEVFSDEWTNYILAYRLSEPAEEGGGEPGMTIDAESLELDLTQPPKRAFTQVLDLIGSRVTISSQGDSSPGGNNPSPPQTVASPFSSDLLEMATYLPTVMDNMTTLDSETIPGRININQAPYEILLGIPGMTEEIAEQIVNLRVAPTEDDAGNRGHEAWILTEGIVDLEQMRSLLPFICAGGEVFRAQIVGYFQGGGPAARAEVVFDATAETPRVLFWRDISHLGRGYALETLGVDLTEAITAQPPR